MTEVGEYSSSEIAWVIGGNVVCVGALNSLSLYEQRVKVFSLVFRPSERWQSGRMWRSRNPLYRKVPGVRIPLSPQRGFKVTAKWSSEKPSKQEEIVVGHGLTTIFLCTQSIDLTAYP